MATAPAAGSMPEQASTVQHNSSQQPLPHSNAANSTGTYVGGSRVATAVFCLLDSLGKYVTIVLPQ